MIDWTSELLYQLKRLLYAITTPRVVRDAEKEVRRSWILYELEVEEEEGY